MVPGLDCVTRRYGQSGSNNDHRGVRVACSMRSIWCACIRAARECWLTIALAWCVWVVLWLPVLAAVSDRFAAALPWASPTGYRSLEALRRLLEVFPLSVGVVVAVLAVNGAGTWLHRFLRKANRRQDVGTQELAAGLHLPEDKLSAWQGARVVRATHSDDGRFIDAQIVR